MSAPAPSGMETRYGLNQAWNSRLRLCDSVDQERQRVPARVLAADAGQVLATRARTATARTRRRSAGPARRRRCGAAAGRGRARPGTRPSGRRPGPARSATPWSASRCWRPRRSTWRGTGASAWRGWWCRWSRSRLPGGRRVRPRPGSVRGGGGRAGRRRSRRCRVGVPSWRSSLHWQLSPIQRDW